MGDLHQMALELLKNGYDLHIHSQPSVFPRELDSFELVREADSFGMAGVMLKSHYEPTATRATLVNKYSGVKTQAYGGLVLNWPVGGLNPYAVENALKAGAKIIWMPTRDSKHSLSYGNMSGDFFKRPGITIMNDEGKISGVVYEILDIIKKHGAFLATGHLSPYESVQLCKESIKNGTNIILTHPEYSRTLVPIDTQIDLAKLGVLIEKNWLNVVEKTVSIEQMAYNIKSLGEGRVYIATDKGQKGQGRPTTEMLKFVESLLKSNVNESEIRSAIKIVPKSIVD